MSKGHLTGEPHLAEYSAPSLHTSVEAARWEKCRGSGSQLPASISRLEVTAPDLTIYESGEDHPDLIEEGIEGNFLDLTMVEVEGEHS